MRPGRDALAVGPAIAFIVLFSLVPVVLLLATSLANSGGLRGFSAAVGAPLNARSIGNSLVQGGLSAAIAVAVGYPVGVFFGRYDWPGRSVLRSFLLIPFLLPSLVVVFGILDLFGPSGLVSGTVPALAIFSGGLPGIVAANLVFNVPVVILFTATGAENASPELEETVATLGGSPRRTYRDVWGPPTLVGASVGGLLTFLFSALSFAPPLLLCGPRCYTAEVQVWSLDQNLLQPAAAGDLALAMVLLFLGPTILYLLLVRRLRPVPGQRSFRARPIGRRPIALALGALTALVLLAELGVMTAVLYRTAVPVGSGGPGSAWAALFSPRTTAQIGVSAGGMVANTLLFAIGATAIAVLLGIVLGYAVVGRPGRAYTLGLVLFLPLLISPVLLAFSLASFWRPLLGGEPNVWMLVIVSQAILAMPFALQSLQIPLSGLSRGPRESAQTLGASPWQAFLETDLPRVRNGVATAGLFAFALGLGEFTATYFLVTPRYATLTVALARLPEVRGSAVADAAAGLLLLLSLAGFAARVAGGGRGAL